MTGRLYIRLGLAALLIISLALLVSGTIKHPHPHLPIHKNQLATGKHARLSAPMEIQINPAVEFDFKKKSEILKLRSDAVHPSMHTWS